jgi:hypothetical protein
VNNNPFEYWITHQSEEYVNLMNDVQRVMIRIIILIIKIIYIYIYIYIYICVCVCVKACPPHLLTTVTAAMMA